MELALLGVVGAWKHGQGGPAPPPTPRRRRTMAHPRGNRSSHWSEVD
jgi:hypothetical protein